MSFLEGLFQNSVFEVAFVSWFIAQFLKVVLTLIVHKELNLSRFIGSGGMPSSHSSMVVGLTTAVGIKSGWHSEIFAVCMVFSLIVMYDAAGVRRAVGKQAAILNQLIHEFYETHHIPQQALKELVGHTPVEVFAGALLGIVVANLLL